MPRLRSISFSRRPRAYSNIDQDDLEDAAPPYERSSCDDSFPGKMEKKDGSQVNVVMLVHSTGLSVINAKTEEDIATYQYQFLQGVFYDNEGNVTAALGPDPQHFRFKFPPSTVKTLKEAIDRNVQALRDSNIDEDTGRMRVSMSILTLSTASGRVRCYFDKKNMLFEGEPPAGAGKKPAASAKGPTSSSTLGVPGGNPGAAAAPVQRRRGLSAPPPRELAGPAPAAAPTTAPAVSAAKPAPAPAVAPAPAPAQAAVPQVRVANLIDL